MAFCTHLCSLLVYEVTVSTVETLERKISSCTREALAYLDSGDARVASVSIVVRTGRKFKTKKGLEPAEAQGKAGSHPTTTMPPSPR